MMITWMQHRKKYLVITIWIATIAFIGAGFVGWGAYSFNTDRASAVAKVGDRKITVEEFQLAYANYFNYFNQKLGKDFNQEKADQMNLDKTVMKNIIDETLFLNYADEIGLKVLPAEIKSKIANDKAFQINGVFNKNTYYRVVKSSGIKPKEYEKSLEKQLLKEKLQAVLTLPPTKVERDIFNSALFMQDRLSVGIIGLNQNELKVSEADVKKYWDEHKQDYLTKRSYDLKIIEVPLTTKKLDEKKLRALYTEKKYKYKGNDGKILKYDLAKTMVEHDLRLKETKRTALESYLLFKKSQMDSTGKLTIKEDAKNFPVDKLQFARIGEVLKPIEQNNGYIVVKVVNINEPAPKAYADAKAAILKNISSQKQTTELQKKAEARLNLFQGQDIGFISRDSQKIINGLDLAQSVEFINFVFDTNKDKFYKIVDNKAILYKILEQKLLPNGQLKRYADLINKNIEQVKSAELNQNIITKFRKRYSVEQYYKGK